MIAFAKFPQIFKKSVAISTSLHEESGRASRPRRKRSIFGRQRIAVEDSSSTERADEPQTQELQVQESLQLSGLSAQSSQPPNENRMNCIEVDFWWSNKTIGEKHLIRHTYE